MTEKASVSQLVVIGASAGGIEALSTLVSTLPTDFAAPIVVAQHLDPRRVSHLREILSARSTLPVRTVEAQEALAPGVVYVVPANRYVAINDHMVSVSETGRARAKPSIDLLFATAAQVFGEGLFAVILTGTGSDGADGARAVKNSGGTVIIQNPETASFPGMPLSLAPTTVDIVANLESIGSLLQDLLRGAYRTMRGDVDPQLRALLDQLRERSSIDFSNYKMPTIMRRLQRRMVANGSENLGQYMRFLQRNPDEYQRLINSFLIKVTEFFRDPDLFAYLRDQVLPDLIADARRSGELRIWSAGCATGEEAYSLAILASELLGEDRDLNVRIFATDLDAEAVAFARRGVYPASAVAETPPELVERYFTPLDGAYEVKKAVRGRVVFGQHDLGQRAPFPRIDLALCRNVLIYFTTELQRRALQLFAFSLRNGGALVLGKAETVTPLAEFFVLEQSRLKIYRRVGERVLIPPARIRDGVPVRPARIAPARRLGAGAEQASARAQREVQRARGGEHMDGLMQRLPVGLVVVDRHFDILAINNMARRLLGIHTSAIGDDFIHLVQSVPLMPLRDAIDKAFKGEAPPSDEVATVETATGEAVYLTITCYPERLDMEGPGGDAVAVMIADGTTATRQRQDLEQSVERYRSEAATMTAQMQRLTETNRQLLAANQELTAANYDLRNSHEELLVSNEEAQAATEEIETLNEELQATNEELETLNEELQATVEELNTTNDDLQARSVELQDLAVSLEEQRRVSDTERTRLAAILTSIGDAVLVVDREGRPVLNNAAYQALFGDRPWTPVDEAGQPLKMAETPQMRTARGEAFDMRFKVVGPDGAAQLLEVNGQPVRDTEGSLEWGVLVIRKARPPVT